MMLSCYVKKNNIELSIPRGTITLELWWQMTLLLLSIPMAVAANLLTPAFRHIGSTISSRLKKRQAAKQVKRYQFLKQVIHGDHIAIMSLTGHLHLSLYNSMIGMTCIIINVVILFAFEPTEWAHPDSLTFVARAFVAIALFGAWNAFIGSRRAIYYFSALADAQSLDGYRERLIRKYGEYVSELLPS